ncbi:MAG: 30S ribosomal protein S6--L-glutamate ligase [Balneolaceae bacterium]
MEDKKLRIAILSRNRALYSTKRLIEAIEKRGHRAVVLDHLKCDIVIEQDRPTIYYHGEEVKNVSAVIPRIGASVTFYGAAVVRQFEMMNIPTAIESQALVRSRDKLRSLQILARSNIGMPKTVFTNYSKEVDKIIDSVGGAPLIVKLLEGTQGYGVVLAPTKKAAESMIEAFHSMKARVIVQEFISEAKGADIRAFVIGNRVVGAMKRQGKEGEFRSNLHQGGSGVLIKLSKKEREVALTAAKSMNLSIAGVDMLQSDRGPLVLEVNSSPGLEGIEKATHKDIATEIVKYMELLIEQSKVRKKSGRRKIKSNA